jgi:hypothetical protein
MTRLLDEAVAEAAKLTEAEQDRIGRELMAHVQKVQRLREDLDRGIRSLDAGEGREIDFGDLLRRARLRNAGRLEIHAANKTRCSDCGSSMGRNSSFG